MDTSYQNIDRTPIANIPDQAVLKSKSINNGGCLLIALGIITLIGCLVAAGCLYSQLGYTSFAIAGAGIVLCILSCLLGKYGCVNTTTITPAMQTMEESNTQPTEEVKHSDSSQTLPPKVDNKIDTPTIQTSSNVLNIPQTSSGSMLSSESPTSNITQTLNNALQPNESSTPPPSQPIPPKIDPLPPLPFILDLTLDPSNSLSKALPIAQFQKQDKDVAFLYGRILARGESSVGDHSPDDELLDIPLAFWIKKDPVAYNAAKYLRIMTDVMRQEQVSIINARIMELDQTFQFKERLLRLNYPYLKVRDLLPAWADSRLRLVLMMDDELSSLTVTTGIKLGNVVWDRLVTTRILSLKREQNDYYLPVNLTKNTIENMLLMDLIKLKAQHIHAAPADFPPITFLFMDFSELQKIEINRLNTDQLLIIFSSTYFNNYLSLCYYVQLLQPNQINSCIPLIKDKKLFSKLSDEQILKFDFEQIDQDIFNAIFDRDRAPTLLPRLEINLIYKIAPFFSHMHWACIGEKHILAIDFLQIPESKRQDVFNILFSSFGNTYSNAAQFLPKLDINRIYGFIPFFSDEHWAYIGEKHILAFDLLQIPEPKRQDVFNIIFSPYGGTYSNAAKFLPKLSATQSNIVRSSNLSKDSLKYLKN